MHAAQVMPGAERGAVGERVAAARGTEDDVVIVQVAVRRPFSWPGPASSG
jgi:hypothetical protein